MPATLAMCLIPFVSLGAGDGRALRVRHQRQPPVRGQPQLCAGGGERERAALRQRAVGLRARAQPVYQPGERAAGWLHVFVCSARGGMQRAFSVHAKAHTTLSLLACMPFQDAEGCGLFLPWGCLQWGRRVSAQQCAERCPTMPNAGDLHAMAMDYDFALVTLSI